MAVPFNKNININNQRSIESEQALLACMLTDNNKIDDVIPIVKKEMFYSEFNALVWDKIVTLYKNGVPVDVTTVKSQLRKHPASSTWYDFVATIDDSSQGKFTLTMESSITTTVSTFFLITS